MSPKFSQFLAHFPFFSFNSFSYPFLSTPSLIPGPPVDLRGALACAPTPFPSPSVRCQPRVAGAPDLEGRSPTTSPASRTQQHQSRSLTRIAGTWRIILVANVGRSEIYSISWSLFVSARFAQCAHLPQSQFKFKILTSANLATVSATSPDTNY